jgi:sialate O-acetylesterase
VNNSRITIEFDDAGAGLAAREGGESVSGFAIAGADRRWVWAEAHIEGGRVVAWSPQVAEPVGCATRGNSAESGLVGGSSGLPAAPFRTDDW